VPALSPGGWRVDVLATATNRVYVLERSVDLHLWAEATAPTIGSGGPLSLTDTNTPAVQAWYRVACRRP
jgi:hypothetical protein